VTNKVLDEYLPADAAASDRLASRTANHIAYQEYRRVPEEVYEEVNDAIVFWWGVMPGETAYPWIFPNADRVCRIGLTMPIGLDIDDFDRDAYALLDADDESIPRGSSEYVRRLLEWQYGDEYDIEEDFPIVEDAGKRNGTETYPISRRAPSTRRPRSGSPSLAARWEPPQPFTGRRPRRGPHRRTRGRTPPPRATWLPTTGDGRSRSGTRSSGT